MAKKSTNKSTQNTALKLLGTSIAVYVLSEVFKIAVAEQHELSKKMKSTESVVNDLNVNPDINKRIVKQASSLEAKGQEVYAINGCGVPSGTHIGQLTGEFGQLDDGLHVAEVRTNAGTNKWLTTNSIKTQ